MADIVGTNADETLAGTANAEGIYGLGGHDMILSGGSGDSIYGGDGNDFIEVSSGAVLVNGDAGSDRFRLTGISSGLPDTAFDGGLGIDTFDAQNVWAGSNYLFITDDSFNGGSEAGSFRVADNHVRGVEVIYGSALGPNWFLLQEMLTSMTLHGGQEGDVFYASFAHADVMLGYGGDDRIGVRPGDTAYGGTGNDFFELYYSGDGIADGGDGIDTLDLGFGWSVDLASEWAGGPAAGSRYAVTNVENVSVHAWRAYATSVAGDGHDNKLSVDSDWDDGSVGVTFDGRGGNDQLFGSTSPDELQGGDGHDSIEGFDGNDSLNGGSGIDTASYDGASAAVSIDLLIIGAQNTGGAGTDVLANFENLIGSQLADTLGGDDENNILDGRIGEDWLYGRLGNDTFHVNTANDRAFENAGEGYDAVLTSASYALQAGNFIERLATSDEAGISAINLTGNEISQDIVGNAGNNVLNGAGGDDWLHGGIGNDLFFVDSANDKVFDDGGVDGIYVNVSYVLHETANVEALSADLLGGTAAISLTGNQLAQELWGNMGNNMLDGKGGDDVLFGIGGSDLFGFSSALGADNIDRIFGFDGDSDQIMLSGNIFNSIGMGTLSASAFATGAQATAADHRIIYNSQTGALFYDADGSGAGGAVQFATLDPGANLSAADIFVA